MKMTLMMMMNTATNCFKSSKENRKTQSKEEAEAKEKKNNAKKG